jgi:hypothetical protein
MKKSILVAAFAMLMSSPVFAGWHYLDRVVQVTVTGDSFYVRGANTSGDSCVNHVGFYGTLYHSGTQPGHKEYYAMALLAQSTEKGMACHVPGPDTQNPCAMANCYLY